MCFDEVVANVPRVCRCSGFGNVLLVVKLTKNNYDFQPLKMFFVNVTTAIKCLNDWETCRPL